MTVLCSTGAARSESSNIISLIVPLIEKSNASIPIQIFSLGTNRNWRFCNSKEKKRLRISLSLLTLALSRNSIRLLWNSSNNELLVVIYRFELDSLISSINCQLSLCQSSSILRSTLLYMMCFHHCERYFRNNKRPSRAFLSTSLKRALTNTTYFLFFARRFVSHFMFDKSPSLFLVS